MFNYYFVALPTTKKCLANFNEPFIEELVKVKFFGASVGLNNQGSKCAHFDHNANSQECPHSRGLAHEIRYSLQFNEYPYATAENISHLVLWE